MSVAPLDRLLGESSAIVAALQTGILEVLVDEAFSPRELATRLELDPRGVARLLELLESMGLLQREGSRFQMSEAHRRAAAQLPGSLSGMARLWGGLPGYLRSGQAMMVHPEAERRGAAYERVVAQLAMIFEPGAQHLAWALDGGGRRVLDIGAGSGVWSLAMAERDPRVRVTALDRPEVLPRFMERAKALGVESQVEVIDADYNTIDLSRFDYDRVLLANVLHLEEEEEAARLVGRAAAGLAEGGELVTVDAFPSEELELRRYYDVYRLHLAMRTGGRRAHAESRLRDWYRAAGFEARELLRLDPKQPELGALVARAA